MNTAVISPCGLFRYWLTRRWDAALPMLVFVMLNPSVADASVQDATIRKCMGFAQRLGYGGIVVVNLFAFRATQPNDLWRREAAHQDIIGVDNDMWLTFACLDADVVLAWGANARGSLRALEVERHIKATARNVYALRHTNDGIPQHPLMLPYSCELIAA